VCFTTRGFPCMQCMRVAGCSDSGDAVIVPVTSHARAGALLCELSGLQAAEPAGRLMQLVVLLCCAFQA
jgi:hypothetical protein